jgi:acetate kinase
MRGRFRQLGMKDRVKAGDQRDIRGGVAESQPELIDLVISGLSVLGLGAASASHRGGDRVITAEDTGLAALIVIPREDLELARGAEDMLASMAAESAGNFRR